LDQVAAAQSGNSELESTTQKVGVDGGSNMIDVTVIIPTVRRFKRDGSRGPEYLKSAVTKLNNDLSKDERKKVRFLIMNSDKDPAAHVECAELAKLDNVRVINRPPQDVLLGGAQLDPATAGRRLEDGREVGAETMKWVSAENLDGAYLMEQAKDMSPYVLFLEDDVFPTSNALQKMSTAVRTLKADDMLFLDLYTPKVDWKDPSVWNAVSHLKPYDYFCCTQAMLFPSNRLGGVINFWRTHPSEPVDDNLVNYMKQDGGLKVYATRPNLFQHVGAYSSNPDKSTGIVEHLSVEFYD